MKKLYSGVLKHQDVFYATALFLIIIVGLFVKMADGSHEFISPDSMSPKAVAQGMELAKEKFGDYPLWLPWMFSGLPSVHSFQYISRYYYPHQVFLWLKALGMPWFWVFIIHIVFAGTGGYLLLKKLNLDKLSAFLGAVAFMITPYLITMIVYGHGSQMMTASYIPWIFWGLIRLDKTPSLLNGGVLAILIGLQLLRAHIQVAYYTWLMVGLYLLIRIIQIIRSKEFSQLKLLYFTVFSMILALGMSMSIYYPVSEYTPFSIRGSSGGGAVYEYATQWSFSFSETMTFLLPSFFGFGGNTYWGTMPLTDYPNYMGILILAFAVVGSIFSRNKFKIILIITFILSLLLSFGKHFFIYKFFFDYFPYFNKFRVPVMFLILTQFSVAGLAALGFNHIRFKLEEAKSIKWCLYSLYGWAALSVLLFFVWNPFLDQFKVPNVVRPMIQKEIFTLILFCGITLGLIFIGMKKWLKSSYVLIGIIILSIVDLTIVDRQIIDPAKGTGRDTPYRKSKYLRSYLRPDDVIRFLQKDESQFRILPLQYLMSENRWSAFNIESIVGYHPAKLANYNKIISEVGFDSPSLVRMLNVKYLIHLKPINHPDFSQVFSGNYYIQGQYVPAYVYEYSGFLPRYHFVNSIKSISDPIEQIPVLKQTSFDPARTAILSEQIEEKQFTSKGEVEVEFYSPDKTILSTHTDDEQFLVMSEIYYPNGWNVTIDGDPVKIFETNSILRGIFIPAGDHKISMRFEPDDIRIGNIISMISLLIILITIFTGLYVDKISRRIPL